MFKRFGRISFRLPAILMLAVVSAATAIGVYSYIESSNEVRRQATEKLIALRESRHAALTRYFQSIDEDLNLLAASAQVATALTELRAAFGQLDMAKRHSEESAFREIYSTRSKSGDRDVLKKVGTPAAFEYFHTHNRHHGWFQVAARLKGYYDLFLVSPSGDVIYSVFKEPDFATNLLTGEWSNTGLARAFKRSMNAGGEDSTAFIEYSPYAPSKGAPAAFISRRVENEGRVMGVIVLQMPIGRINSVMQVTAGMGQTGETYLVGPDRRMHSDSRFSEKSTILSIEVNTPTAERALNGESGVAVIDDYRGVSVVSAYQPFTFRGARWAVLAEKDVAELQAPIDDMRESIIFIGIGLSVLVALGGLILTTSITRPLARLSDSIGEFRDTRKVVDLSEFNRGDEITAIAKGFHATTREISEYIDGINQAREELRRSEREIREREERIRSLLEVSPIGFTLARMSGELLLTNAAFGRILRQPPDASTSFDVQDFYQDPEERKQYVETLRREEVVSGFEVGWKRLDGSPIWVTISAKLVDYDGDKAILAWIDDITQRKDAEEELADKTAALETLLETMDQGVTMMDQDLNLIVVNDNVADLLDFPRDLLRAGANMEELFRYNAERGEYGSGDVEDLVRDRMELTRNFEPHRFERTRPDGTVIEIRGNILANRTGFVSTYTDVTERKRAEEAIAEQAALLNNILENANQGIAAFDDQFRLIACNRNYQQIVSLPDALTAPGVHMLTLANHMAEMGFYGPGDVKTLAENRVEALTSGQTLSSEVTTNDGRTYFSVVQPSPGGGCVVTFTDITERKVAEEELKAQSERVELLRKTASDANTAVNFGAALRTCINTVCDHTGWPIGHVYFVSEEDDRILVPSDIWHLDDPSRFAAFIEASEDTTFEYGIGLPGRVRESGEPAWIVDVAKDSNFPRATMAEDAGLRAAFAFPVLAGGNVVAVLEFFGENPVAADELLLATVAHIGSQLGRVFERKQAELELRFARDAAEEATKAKASFLATMSHEIRTPMGGVIGMIDLLQQTQLDDDQLHMTSTVRNSANSLLTIINDILDFSKIEAGKLDLEAVPISIRDCVEGVGEALAVNARNKAIGLAVYVDPDIPDAVMGDQVRVRQILLNLGGNAVKFTEEGKVLIRADRVPCDETGKITIQFRIIDDGIGIPEEAQANLFAAFSQVEASTTRRFGGTGLGLSICQRLTELMAGEIGVESEPGVGSTFHSTITFPIAEKHAIKSDGEDLEGLNILLAIQDDDMRDLIPRYLEHWRARVTAIKVLDELQNVALDAAAKGAAFDVIGLISGLPLAEQIALVEGMNGLEQLAPKRFVVACAGRDRSERKAVENTMYIDTDPMIRERLIRTIAAAVGRISPDISYEDENLPEVEVKAPTVAEAEATGRLILFAEDNLTNQDVIGRQLKLLGYAFEVASDGQEALRMFQAKSHAILLTDCHMPNMDGFELAKSIRELERGTDSRIPIVAITASVMKEEIDACYSAGMDDYLPKPLELNKLKDMLRKRMLEPTGDVPTLPEHAETSDAHVAAMAGNGAIDPTALKNVFGDDEETFKEILQDFVDPATDNLREIEAAFGDRSANGVAKAAHKLKSSARTVGADCLADLCQTLETAGNEENWDEIDKTAPLLAGAMQEVADYIGAL